MKTIPPLILLLWVFAVASHVPTEAQGARADPVRYSTDGKLVRPDDYREWVYLSSGLGMTYGPAGTGRAPMFDNVFVTPESYRQFMKTGTWPEKTMFVLEIRGAETNVSINNGGQTQGGVVAIEAEVKDRDRFPETGWGYFNFGGAANLQAAVAALPTSATCYSCHRQNTAVENTFVQFYPMLMEVARRMGTVKGTYDPAHKVQ
jgi:hypothetical protein